MRKDEFVSECSDIDDIIVIRKDGKMLVTKVDKKTFVGKNIIHVSVFKKKDDRTTYNMIYKQHDSGKSYMKRFQVTGVTRDKEYEIAKIKLMNKIHAANSFHDEDLFDEED